MIFNSFFSFFFLGSLCLPPLSLGSLHAANKKSTRLILRAVLLLANLLSQAHNNSSRPTDWVSTGRRKMERNFAFELLPSSLSWILFANLLCSRAAASPPKLPASVKIALKCAISNREYISSNNTFELRWAFSDSIRYLSVFLFRERDTKELGEKI